MKSGTRIKVVAFALMAVFLASVAVASFASAASNNAAGKGVYLTFAMSKSASSSFTLTHAWQDVISITTPDVGYDAWWYVVCDGEVKFFDSAGVYIWIVVDGVDGANTGRTIAFGGTGSEYAVAHTERMFLLGPGAHTFSFRASLAYLPYGTGYFMSRSITVIFFTDAWEAH